jgi:hypothetical protein
VNKQIVGWILPVVMVGMAGLGCRSGEGGHPTSESVEWRNFAPQWQAELRPPKDTITDVFVREKSIFVYTKNRQVYSVDRASGRLQTIYKVSSAAARVHPPVVMANNVVYPTNDRLEVYDLKGNFVRTIDLSAAIRSGAATSGKSLYLG